MSRRAPSPAPNCHSATPRRTRARSIGRGTLANAARCSGGECRAAADADPARCASFNAPLLSLASLRKTDVGHAHTYSDRCHRKTHRVSRSVRRQTLARVVNTPCAGLPLYSQRAHLPPTGDAACRPPSHRPATRPEWLFNRRIEIRHTKRPFFETPWTWCLHVA
jgi:hypothetical protein